MNKYVYCEFGFLKEFLTSFPNPIENWEGALSWKRMYNFLYYAYKYIDVPNSQLACEATKNKLLLQLIRNGNYNYDKCFPNLQEPSRIIFNKEKKNSIFLTSLNKKRRESISSEYGIIVIGKDDIQKFAKQYGKLHKAIGKNTHAKWSDFIPVYMKTANSLIILDNYILSDTMLIDENLICILNSLLPYTCTNEFSFPIYIYTYDACEDWKGRYDLINEKIKSIRPDLTFQLSIFKVNKEDFHDRNVITNNLYIECGSGFNLLSNETAKKTTNLRISYPFMNYEDGCDSEMEAYINTLSDIIAVDKRDHTYEIDYWGDINKENDLIKFYKQEFTKS